MVRTARFELEPFCRREPAGESRAFLVMDLWQEDGRDGEI